MIVYTTPRKAYLTLAGLLRQIGRPQHDTQDNAQAQQPRWNHLSLFARQEAAPSGYVKCLAPK